MGDVLTKEQKAWLKEYAVGICYIVGGEGAVSREIEEEIRTCLFGSKVVRLAGKDRYATSWKIADVFFVGADTAILARGDDFADALSAKLKILPKIASKINIVFDEIYTNIVNYSKATLATVSYKIEGGKLCLTFIDNGIAYNPLEADDPDVTLSAEERKIGGLGIFMVKKMTESMTYEYTDGKNMLTLVIALS